MIIVTHPPELVGPAKPMRLQLRDAIAPCLEHGWRWVQLTPYKKFLRPADDAPDAFKTQTVWWKEIEPGCMVGTDARQFVENGLRYTI